ncbi:MAG: NFACT family protein [Ktedonobacteraceae bacterium]|nr:NFACT family protein [Ktedonobacteraceae bacterium]
MQQVDAFTLAAIADEWRALLRGARIDTIIQPTEHAVAIQCYAPAPPGQAPATEGKNRWLYLSAHPQFARAHLTVCKPQKIVSEPPPFIMLLRKYLEGARIESIAQPRWERVLEIVAGYRSSPESEDRVHFRLIAEIMGRVSNIILCDEQGMILGALKRVGPEMNRYRVIAPGVPYVPPPPQRRTLAGQSLPRLEPGSVTAAQLALCATAYATAVESELGADTATKRRHAPESRLLWQLLTAHVLGCSPLLAREVVYRATEQCEMSVEQANEAVWEELAWNMRDLASLYDTHQWQPQLVEYAQNESARTDKPKLTRDALLPAFAPYALEQHAELPGVRVRHYASMNMLLDDFFEQAEWRDALESLRAPLRRALQTQRDRCKRKAQALQQELSSFAEAAQYRRYGELLLAHQHEIQRGQSNATVPDIFAVSEDGSMPPVIIPLDPRFDAVGNANRFFNKYHKMRRATELVPGQIEQNDVELATIEQLLADLMLAETPAEVALVKAEVQAAGYLRGRSNLLVENKVRKAAKKASRGKQTGKPVPPGGGVPLHFQSQDGLTILVGKNSRQNEEVTFRQAAAHDIWLHARGAAGAHVLIKAAGRAVPQRTIEQAARLAAYYSEARESTSVPVDYTLQRHVRHMKGGGPGMVIYDHEQTLYAEPALLS